MDTVADVDILAELKRNDEKLAAAWGDVIPEFTEAIRAQADETVEQCLGSDGRSRLGQDEGPAWTRGINPHLYSILGSAYRATNEERYAQAAKAAYRYSLDKEPLKDGTWIPPENLNILMVPHRLGATECIGWFGALPSFFGSRAFDKEFVEELVASARGQLNYLCGTLHDGRNMRITQADSLLTNGIRMAFLPDSEAWRERGLWALNDAFNRTIAPDGASIEATGWYHFIVMNMALRLYLLKQAMPELPVQVTCKQVAGMFEYTSGTIQPDGLFNLIGDSTSRITTGRTLRAVLDRRDEVREKIGLPKEESPLSQFFPSIQQAFLRSGWDNKAIYIAFDATVRNGTYHWHPACNSVSLHAFGRKILGDPGRMHYARTPERMRAVTTDAHNTMNLNGWNQTDAPATFRCRSAEGVDVVDACYWGGYWPGDMDNPGRGVFGRHHRTLLWIRDRFVLVIDHMEHHQHSGEKPDLRCNWQFAPGEVSLDDSAGRRILSKHGDARMLMFMPLMPEGMEMSIHQGEQDPHMGWMADVNDRPVPAPYLRMEEKERDRWNADLATVIVPFQGEDIPEVETCDVVDPEETGWGRVVLRWRGGETDEISWKRRLLFALEAKADLETDAALVHLRKDAKGRMIRAFVFEGSYLRPYSAELRPRPECFVVKP